MEEHQHKKGLDTYLVLALAVVLISIVYWSIFSMNAYSNATDRIRRPRQDGIQHVLRYSLSLIDARAPVPYLRRPFRMLDQLFVLPVFALFPSAATLLIVQAVVISLTGLAAFFITRDLLKSPEGGALRLPGLPSESRDIRSPHIRLSCRGIHTAFLPSDLLLHA